MLYNGRWAESGYLNAVIVLTRCSGSQISKCYIKHEARRAAGMRGPGRERLSLIPQHTIFCLTMPGPRTRARRKASNGFSDNYDWDPIGDLIPRGSPPPSPHHAAAASEDAPSIETFFRRCRSMSSLRCGATISRSMCGGPLILVHW